MSIPQLWITHALLGFLQNAIREIWLPNGTPMPAQLQASLITSCEGHGISSPWPQTAHICPYSLNLGVIYFMSAESGRTISQTGLNNAVHP